MGNERHNAVYVCAVFSFGMICCNSKSMLARCNKIYDLLNTIVYNFISYVYMWCQ
jgi:hypothetical protein